MVMTELPSGVELLSHENGTTGLKPTSRLPFAGPGELALIELPFAQVQEISIPVQILSCVSNRSLGLLIPVRASVTVRVRLVSEMVGVIETVPMRLPDHVG